MLEQQVGVGYLKVEAESPSRARRFRSGAFVRAIAGGRQSRFDPTVGSLPHRDMIEQDAGTLVFASPHFGGAADGSVARPPLFSGC